MMAATMDPLPVLLGSSPAILEVKERVGRLLKPGSGHGRFPPILIQGETGTGKGLLARAIHGAGPRADGPFVAVNCAAIPETLLEAEMFGFERGAFTDARQPKAGLFQAAHRGTIFLDEVGLLPVALQAKLLKVIEERAVRRLGSTRSEAVDVWLITATNDDMVAATRERRFRKDLYHRIAVFPVVMPPLRDRPEDIGLLAEHFLARACADYALPAKSLGADARAALVAYPWPGNIRELGNLMERVALLGEGSRVTAAMLGLDASSAATTPAPAAPPAEGAALRAAVGAVEREHLLAALGETGWNITRAAERLGISRDTLRYRIVKHELREDARAPAGARRARAGVPAVAPEPQPSPRRENVASPALRWEPRRLALLRVGLVVSPASDPRLYPSWTLEMVIEKIQGFGGRVEARSPTGVVAAFGLEPVEDAPRRAAHAAMAIQKAIERARAAGTETAGMRSAVHVGQLLVGHGGGGAQLDLDGAHAAWALLDGLERGAEPDALVASAAARPFLDRHFDLAPLKAAGGADEPAYRVTALERSGLAGGRRLAPFTGRGQELELLRSRLGLARQGHGQVVVILGEAGLGKSRLVHEFQQSLEGLPVGCLVGRCHSYGTDIPYLPILEILRQNFRITDLDPPGTIVEKVDERLASLEMDSGEWAPYILQLFGLRDGSERLAGLSPGAIKFRTFEALRQMGLNGARRRPLVFLVEDLQWCDATSEECLAVLVDSLVGAPGLLVVTYRPGYRPPWADRSNVTQVALAPLSREDGLAVLHSARETPRVSERLARVILDRADGNPFFIEELARAVGDEVRIAAPGAVPETIQEVLLARIDRLAEPARQLLQTAAVLGRHAPLPLLRALWMGPDEVDAHLRELTRLEFLYPRSGGSDPVYAFVHTLTQEVAYESLPLARREALHAGAGRALEQAYAGRLEEAYDRLGYHFSRSGDADKAIEYLTRLADHAAGAQAHREAVRLLEEARRHAERVPAPERERRRVDLILRQAYSLMPQGRFQEILDLLSAHHDAVEQLGDPRVAASCHLLLAQNYMFLGDDPRAVASAERGLADATRAGDGATTGRLHYILSERCLLAGHPREGLAHGQRAIQQLERAGDRWWLATTYWALSVNHSLLGEFDAALEAATRARTLGEAVGDPQAQSTAMWAIGVVHALRGEHDAAIDACRRGLALAPDALSSAMAEGWLGYAHLERQEPAEAIPHLEPAIRRLGQFRFPQLHGLFTVYLAEAHRLAGRPDRAQELARQALDRAHASAARFVTACAWRVLGRIARDTGDREKAVMWLDQARGLLQSMEARHEQALTEAELAALTS